MTNIFISRLQRMNVPYLIVRGSLEERMDQAKTKIDDLLENGWWPKE
jgi:hypothetical protein